MIVAKAPLRVSYLGGGSDFAEFIASENSNVIGTTIQQYVYTNVNQLQKFSAENYRFTYRITESVLAYSDFEHPVVRAVLQYLEWKEPINISTMSDIPGNSGLGSSSAFTVSLLAALHEYRGERVSPIDLAEEAVHVERVILAESGGIQDQHHAAIGGFRRYLFSASETSYGDKVVDQAILKYVSDRQWLLKVGSQRESHLHSEELKKANKQIRPIQRDLSSAANECWQSLNGVRDPKVFYNILSDAISTSWSLKAKLQNVSNQLVDEKVGLLTNEGATAVKLCGAGGSGFLLFLAEEEVALKVQSTLPDGWVLPARIANSGVETFQI